MNSLRLTMYELDEIRDSIFEYINGVEAEGVDDINYSVQLSIIGENRYLMISFILKIFEKQSMFWIVDVSQIKEDEFLDILSETNKNQE